MSHGGEAWYALRTRSRHEKRVEEQLRARGIEPFLPQVERWRQWKDRRKLVVFPLFPGYCFARFALADRVAVLSHSGVAQIVGNLAGPVPVPEGEIELEEGMLVEVIRGPLEGIRGMLIRKGARARLVIRVTLIHQAASVELDAFDVKPAD
jgi:transcription antitermination factor NusG